MPTATSGKIEVIQRAIEIALPFIKFKSLKARELGNTVFEWYVGDFFKLYSKETSARRATTTQGYEICLIPEKTLVRCEFSESRKNGKTRTQPRPVSLEEVELSEILGGLKAELIAVQGDLKKGEKDFSAVEKAFGELRDLK